MFYDMVFLDRYGEPANEVKTFLSFKDAWHAANKILEEQYSHAAASVKITGWDPKEETRVITEAPILEED